MGHTSNSKFRFQLGLTFLFCLFVLLGMSQPAQAGPAAQDITPTPAPTPLPGVPVKLDGKTLFFVYQRVGSISPEERAALISNRIELLAKDPFAPTLEISLAESEQGIDLIAGETILVTVTQADADSIGLSQTEAAQQAAEIIQDSVREYRQQHTPEARLKQFLITMATLAVLFIPLFFLNRFIQRRLDRSEQTPPAAEGGEVHDAAGLYRTRLWRRSMRLLYNVGRVVLVLILFFIISPNILRIFPQTSSIALMIHSYITNTFSATWNWFVEYRRDLLAILVILLVTYGLTHLVRAFFVEVAEGTIRLGKFDPEWAPFTSRIITFLLMIGALIVAFPYIPGSDSEGFRGISVFLGLLFTLSSTAAVANIVSGVIQTYTGAFRVGDVIKIGDTTGIVEEKRLLTTRLRTFKEEEVSIPNSLVMNAQVVNYSVQARSSGLVLYTTVTIGYDAPWRKVHELLLKAAADTPDILSDPAPFVLQNSLNDYHISYQLNAYTRRPEIMPRLYATLHQSIQDEFNKAGVEIMSPAFSALRDGNSITIPPENRPGNYQAPGFRLDNGK